MGQYLNYQQISIILSQFLLHSVIEYIVQNVTPFSANLKKLESTRKLELVFQIYVICFISDFFYTEFEQLIKINFFLDLIIVKLLHKNTNNQILKICDIGLSKKSKFSVKKS